MFDIVGMGTALVDFSAHGSSENGSALFEGNPGGSVANFLVAAGRQGARCAILCKLGDDMLGRILIDALTAHGVDVRGVVLSRERQTPCALVRLGEDGEREFMFYREGTADSTLAPGEVDFDLIDGSRALHITSFMLPGDLAFESAMAAIKRARSGGKLVSFDVNWRPRIWADRAQGIARLREAVARADVLKVSEEEFTLLAGCAPCEAGAQALFDMGPKLVIATFGSGGSTFFARGASRHVPAFPVRAVDTTGAGDCCFATFMWEFLRLDLSLDAPDPDMLAGALRYANLAASYCVARRGGIPSMPSRRELEAAREAAAPS
jgi:fructokinase